MAEKYYLTDGDRALIQEFLVQQRNSVPRGRYSEGLEPDSKAPDVYAVITPSGGIPGLQAGLHTTGTGTGSHAVNRPGFADDLQVYYVYEEADGIMELLEVPGLTVRVYNLSTAAMEGNMFTLVLKDKFGRWFAAPQGAGGGSDCVLTFITGICRA